MFLRGLAEGGEPTSGIFKLQKFRTDKNIVPEVFLKIKFNKKLFLSTTFYKTRIFASLQITMLVVQENNIRSTSFIF